MKKNLSSFSAIILSLLISLTVNANEPICMMQIQEIYNLSKNQNHPSEVFYLFTPQGKWLEYQSSSDLNSQLEKARLEIEKQIIPKLRKTVAMSSAGLKKNISNSFKDSELIEVGLSNYLNILEAAKADLEKTSLNTSNLKNLVSTGKQVSEGFANHRLSGIAAKKELAEVNSALSTCKSFAKACSNDIVFDLNLTKNELKKEIADHSSKYLNRQNLMSSLKSFSKSLESNIAELDKSLQRNYFIVSKPQKRQIESVMHCLEPHLKAAKFLTGDKAYSQKTKFTDVCETTSEPLRAKCNSQAVMALPLGNLNRAQAECGVLIENNHKSLDASSLSFFLRSHSLLEVDLSGNARVSIALAEDYEKVLNNNRMKINLKSCEISKENDNQQSFSSKSPIQLIKSQINCSDSKLSTETKNVCNQIDQLAASQISN